MGNGVAPVAAMAALWAVWGCNASTTPGIPFEVRDSGGVTIAVSMAVPPGTDATVVFSSEPLTVIDGPFSEIRGVEILQGGGVVIADGYANQIRVYSASGELLRRIGGDGDGPNEFRGPSLVRDMTDPSVLYAYDRRSRRVLQFDPAHGVLSPIGNLDKARRVLGSLAPVGAANGRLIFQTNNIDESKFMSREAGTFPFTQRVWSIDGKSGEQILLAEHEVPFVHKNERNGMAWNIPFAPRIAATALSSGTAVVSPGPAEVRLHDHTGMLSRVFRISAGRSRVDEVALKHWNEVLDPTEGGSASPDSVPFFDRIIADDRDRVWVRRYEMRPNVGTEWFVFTAEGRLAGVAMVPAGLEVRSIYSGYAAGVISGDFDEERVAVYSISGARAN